MRHIQVMVWSAGTDLPTLLGNPNAISGDDYITDRAGRLFAALGVDPTDEEYTLAELPDGHWTICGMTVEGHRWAREKGE